MQQQQQPMSQQNVTPQPPNVITTKDHAYLEDMLNWNLEVIKKANFYSGQCQDQDVKNALAQVCQMHEQHYDRLLSHFQNSNQNPPNM